MRRRAILLLFLTSSFCLGAFHAATEWDIRTTGNDANGGGFQASATGTDYSQQDTAHYAYTDIVIGALNTKATSVARPFSAVDPGNIINITAGTNCTVQRAQVVSQVGGVATFDKALGTIGSTCTGNLGGSLASPNVAASLVYQGNTVHIKAGTYTQTVTIGPYAYGNIRTIGYETTHEDGGTRPLITSSTDDLDLVTMTLNYGAPILVFDNLNFTHTAASKGNGLHNATFQINLVVLNCDFEGFDQAINLGVATDSLYLENCDISNNVYGIWGYARGMDESWSGLGGLNIVYCRFSENSSAHVYSSYIYARVLAIRSLFVDGGSYGIQLTSTITLLHLYDCTVANNGDSGIDLPNAGWNKYSIPLALVNTIIYGNGGYGVSVGNATYKTYGVLLRNNAYGANVTADRNNVDAGTADVTLTADPFTNAAAGDYSLNNAAGGGALLKAAGFPGVFPGGTITGYLDIGAAQSQTGGAAAAHGSAFVQ